jgi:uncharacterized protein
MNPKLWDVTHISKWGTPVIVSGRVRTILLIQAVVFLVMASLGHSVQLATQAFVADEAGILSDKQRDQINTLISGHNAKGPRRIHVVIVDKLPTGTSIEQFASARINQPPPGAGEKLDRVLLAIAVQDRKMRIETSKEVWPVLPDAFCKGVIDKTIAPQFKEKNYFQGIHAGVSALINKLVPR